MMTWQEKLKRLIQADQQGHPTLRFGLRYWNPVPSEQVQHLAEELGFELPQVLQDLYAISDGIVIGVGLTICHLSQKGYYNLRSYNERYLRYVQRECSTTQVQFILGSNNGHFLCSAWNGSVVEIDSHAPIESVHLADSLNKFLDEFCLGDGYIKYTQLPFDSFWPSILKEFGYLNREYGQYDNVE